MKRALHFPVKIKIPEELGISREALCSVCPGCFLISNHQTEIIFEKNTAMAWDYRIALDGDKVKISYVKAVDAFYGLVALCYHDWEDKARVADRGFMLDISRGRVPKVETLKRLIDILARFKYNQLQLYVEGFSYSYPSFQEYCDENAALTVEEMQELSAYCAE